MSAPAGGAFRDDPAVKADLLARLRRHADNGTLIFGATQWDGQGGSPLGVSVKGGDSADYVVLYGYPLALAGLLDPLMAWAVPEDAVDHTLQWVSRVAPGNDLSAVPEAILDHLLVDMGADRLAEPNYSELRGLHRREASDDPPARRCWSRLRGAIERAEAAAAPGSDTRAALNACAIACWPLRTSASVLATLVGGWAQDATRMPDPDFTEADHKRATKILERIYQETQPLRDAGEAVHIPTLFRSREPALAADFEAWLGRNNARFFARAHKAPGLVIDLIAAHAS